jgi:hypothetical protein
MLFQSLSKEKDVMKLGFAEVAKIDDSAVREPKDRS